MMRWIVALVAGLAVALPAQAFRCGTHLVHDGDTRAEVRARCGEPSDIERRSVWRRRVVWIDGRRYFVSQDLVEIPVESWIYNLGPNRFMRRVRFEDGLVVEVETLGYGYHEPR